MKKRFFSTILALAALLMLVSPEAFAYSERVNALNINVSLSADGTAYITETWDVVIADDSTEWYLVQGNLGDIEIRDFSVRDENDRVFQNEGHSWNVERSRSQKDGKCGIVDKSDGYELCWGVGSAGKHVFTASYTMTNFIKAYTDNYDGFLQRFVNDSRNSPIEDFSITIEKQDSFFSEDTVKMWAFGFDGTINFENGKIVARSQNEIEKSQYVNLMLRFNENIFVPSSISSSSFQSVLEGAFKGSDYDIDSYEGSAVIIDNYNKGSGNADYNVFNAMSGIIRFFAPVMFFGAFALIPYLARVKKRKKAVFTGGSLDKSAFKDVPWCRDIPFNGDLPAAEYVLKAAGETPEDTALMGAYLLRWSYKGYVRINEVEKNGFLGIGGGKQPVIEFLKPLSESADSAEQKLYGMMYKASRDGVLENKEFSRWAQENYEEIDEWYDYTEKHAERILKEGGCITTVKESKLFGLINTEKSVFSETGNELTVKTLGFKAYLRDFTLINERRAVEVELWDEYLVFATLFGIADTVKNEFSALYPKYFTEPVEGNPYMTRRDIFTRMYLINIMSRSAYNSASQGRSAASMSSASTGGGGFSSFGGGGGFSGGGSGGGGGR